MKRIHPVVKPVALACLCLLFSSCAPERPALARSGILQPGATLQVANRDGDINAYAPERHGAQDRYSVEAFGPFAGAVTFAAQPLLVRASASAPGVRFLLRAPKGTALDLRTIRGNISVADYAGIVNAQTGAGDIKMLIPRYGNAATGKGNISVYFASTDWPGTLRFTAADGNVEVYVNENAKARIRMHTDDGTVFSDFNITGTSSGSSETIDAPVNGGGPRSIDVEVHRGSIRVMQLKPQI